jgi:5-methylcytosine-specific restriction endonuclease McrA
MKNVPVSRLSNDALIAELRTSVADDCARAAREVELIAEIQRRRLYAAAGYHSMYAYCIGEMRLSEDAAYKRLQVARRARTCPGILVALAEGRVHLSGLTLLATHLKPGNVDELLAAATHKSKREIERIVAERFPKQDLPALVSALPQPSPWVAAPENGPAQPQVIANTDGEPAPGQVGEHVIPRPAPTASVPPPATGCARVAPLAPQRYGVQFTLDQAGHDLLRHVQNLLGNRVPPGDLAAVFQRALEAFAAQLEKQKWAATERPSRAHRPCGPSSRHISAPVKRAVWKRDKGQCSYVSDSGKRCESRWDLEFDHEQEYARGGEATVSNIRLRCRAHNQYAAERTYGAEFMQHKRAMAADARDPVAEARPCGPT